jgi:ABC-2 type transport system permease protein
MATVSEIEVSATDADRPGGSPASDQLPITAPGGDRRLPSRVVSARVNLRFRLVELWRCRELMAFLVRKELKVKYKNSVLGFAWSMLNPALVLAVYYVVFTVFLPSGIPHFALFLFSGLLAWNLFNNALMGAAGAIVNNAGIVKKVAFPREILALSQVGTACVFFGFQATVLIMFFAGFRYAPDWALLPLLPFALLALIAFTSAFAIFLSAVNVYLRDTQHLIEVVLQAWFWGAPIVYGFHEVYAKLSSHRLFMIPHTHLIWLYLADPLAPIVLTFQRALYGRSTWVNIGGKLTAGGPASCPGNTHPGCVYVLHTYPTSFYVIALSVVLVGSIGLFLLAMLLFGRIEGNFAEEL